MNDKSSPFGTFIGGLVLGGLVGAAIAILNAPQSGQETIADLKQKSEEIRKEIEQAAESTRQQADELLASMQRKTDKVVQEAEATASSK